MATESGKAFPVTSDPYLACLWSLLSANTIATDPLDDDDRHLFSVWLVLKQDLATRSDPVSDPRYKYAFDCVALSEHIL